MGISEVEAPQHNTVFQLLKGLVENPPQHLHYGNDFYALDGADTPDQWVLTVVQGKLRALKRELKVRRDADKQ